MKPSTPTRSALVYGAAANAGSRLHLFAATVRYVRLYHKPKRRRVADTINAALVEFTERPEGMVLISKERFEQQYIKPAVVALSDSVSDYYDAQAAKWMAAGFGLNGGSQ